MATSPFTVGTRVCYKDEPGMTGTVAEVVMVEKNGAKSNSQFGSGMVHQVPAYRVSWDQDGVADARYYPSELKRLRLSKNR